MISGELRSKVGGVWGASWLGRISNPLEVSQQITHLLFLRRLDELQTLAERKANVLGEPIASPIYPPARQPLRWAVGRSGLASGSSGSTKTIPKKKLYELPLPVVDLAEQREFEDQVQVRRARRSICAAMVVEDGLFAPLQSRASRGEL
ncbi:hypothetical protein C0Z11_01325 [Acidipropionibacterium jensenii]|uniref:type I restriction-modification system subunit M N-terminal domain-containing protein n=1 Tax=Acidipropionibacterium jensenii TaxID=1749 RepID=UPI000BEF186E|nr:type I restriction-modification system subunit M N-terminal domain-containing protein [Acidipropionibacterium jensenii]AZZ41151.1 hypothetical protein C0Z11_01325 [Acidipropionibacterium jensenii]